MKTACCGEPDPKMPSATHVPKRASPAVVRAARTIIRRGKALKPFDALTRRLAPTRSRAVLTSPCPPAVAVSLKSVSASL
jgi:hypothetical protein